MEHDGLLRRGVGRDDALASLGLPALQVREQHGEVLGVEPLDGRRETELVVRFFQGAEPVL
jgi:hypothetical protein